MWLRHKQRNDHAEHQERLYDTRHEVPHLLVVHRYVVGKIDYQPHLKHVRRLERTQSRDRKPALGAALDVAHAERNNQRGKSHGKHQQNVRQRNSAPLAEPRRVPFMHKYAVIHEAQHEHHDKAAYCKSHLLCGVLIRVALIVAVGKRVACREHHRYAKHEQHQRYHQHGDINAAAPVEDPPFVRLFGFLYGSLLAPCGSFLRPVCAAVPGNGSVPNSPAVCRHF